MFLREQKIVRKDKIVVYLHRWLSRQLSLFVRIIISWIQPDFGRRIPVSGVISPA